MVRLSPSAHAAVALVVFATLAQALAPAVARAAPVGVAAMGDSLVDEYQFALEPPGRADGVARGFVEVLAVTRPDDFYFGAYSTTGRGEPRLRGYEYNWGREELATTTGMVLSQGQHTGAAAQAAAGQVRLGMYVAGSNDFRGVFLAPDPVAALSDPTLVPGMLTNVATAAQTFLAAHPDARIVVANIPDVTRVPRLKAALDANPQFAPLFAGVENVIDIYNQNLAATFAANDRVAVANLNGLFDSILAAEEYTVGGEVIDRDGFGTNPLELFVDDLHPGTIAQAQIANLFIDAANARFGTDVARLSDQEILRVAAVPAPAALWAAFAAAPAVAAAMRRARKRLAA